MNKNIKQAKNKIYLEIYCSFSSLRIIICSNDGLSRHQQFQHGYLAPGTDAIRNCSISQCLFREQLAPDLPEVFVKNADS